jgi:integrase/recombinase XerD
MNANSTAPSVHITGLTAVLPAVRSWEYFLQDQSRSIYTIKAFKGDLELFASYLAPDRSVGSITTDDLNNFLTWLQAERGVPCSPKSLGRRITSLKAFFRWLARSGVLLLDPAEKVLQQSVMSPLPQVLTAEEEEKVVRAAMDQRTGKRADARSYTLLALLLTTGIKKGECLAVNLNHLELDAEGGPFLYVRYANPASRYKERKIDLTSDWVEAFREYSAQYEPKDKLFPWSPRRLEYLLEDLGKAAGLDKHLSFDMCRWTGALNDWKSETDRDRVRQKLGISRIQWREVSLKLRQLSGETLPVAAPSEQAA